MEPGSGIDSDDHIPEPVHHGPLEDSNAATSPSPSAVAAAGGAAASSPSPSPSPPPAAPVDRPREPVREQAVGGTHGSSSAAAGVDQKGKGPRPPAEEEEKKKLKAKEGKVKSSQAKKALWSRIKSFFTPKKMIVAIERRKIYSQHVGRKTLPINQVGYYHYMTKDVAVYMNHLDAYSRFRPVHGDGECFYRSFIFSYLEQVLDRQDTQEERRLLDAVETVYTDYTNLGWAIEFRMSCEAFKKLINDVMEWKRQGRGNNIVSTNSYCKEKLLDFFGIYDTTNDILVFLRLVAAIQICSHGDEYVQRITGLNENCSLTDWCFRHVTPPRTPTDHVMMVALGAALEVSLKVERLDGAGGAQDIYIGPGLVSVTLLFTDGHYVIIYPRAPPAGSSRQQTS
ncbi:unnamed protein product [Alopecurus aequalis]